MFKQEDLNNLDYTFAFLEVKKSNSLLDKVFLQKEIVVSLIRQLSTRCVENSVFNSVRTAYTIQNPCFFRAIPARSAGGRVILARPAGGRVPFFFQNQFFSVQSVRSVFQ